MPQPACLPNTQEKARTEHPARRNSGWTRPSNKYFSERACWCAPTYIARHRHSRPEPAVREGHKTNKGHKRERKKKETYREAAFFCAVRAGHDGLQQLLLFPEVDLEGLRAEEAAARRRATVAVQTDLTVYAAAVCRAALVDVPRAVGLQAAETPLVEGLAACLATPNEGGAGLVAGLCVPRTRLSARTHGRRRDRTEAIHARGREKRAGK